jgi:hypothetical protein
MELVIRSVENKEYGKLGLVYCDRFNTVYLTVNGKMFIGNDVYLSIKKDGVWSGVNSYLVKGVFGFGGMGYRGDLSTIKLLKGLNKIGLNIDAKELRSYFKKDIA